MEGKIDAKEFLGLENNFFHAVDSNTLAPNDLDTGDILLFSRRCADMNLFGALICYGAKVCFAVFVVICSSSLLGTIFVLLLRIRTRARCMLSKRRSMGFRFGSSLRFI